MFAFSCSGLAAVVVANFNFNGPPIHHMLAHF